jgi:hypothetical protein
MKSYSSTQRPNPQDYGIVPDFFRRGVANQTDLANSNRCSAARSERSAASKKSQVRRYKFLHDRRENAKNMKFLPIEEGCRAARVFGIRFTGFLCGSGPVDSGNSQDYSEILLPKSRRTALRTK